MFIKGDPAGYGKPARTADVTKNGGWFGGAAKAPDILVSGSSIDADMHRDLVESMTRSGFWGPTAYYLNHDVNKQSGLCPETHITLEMPVLFIEARWDHVCATLDSTMSESMRKYCPNLTEASIEAAHWVGFEKASEVNAELSKWLQKNLPETWSGA